jgi:hypothetical protein
MSSQLYGVYAKTPGRWRFRDLLPDRYDIPYIGWMLNPREDKSPPTAFGTESVWIPCTVAAMHVPEATIPLHSFRLDRRRHHAPYDFAHHRKLDGVGLPGWHMRSDPQPSDALLRRLLEGPLPELLRRREHSFFQLLVLRGDPDRTPQRVRHRRRSARRARVGCRPGGRGDSWRLPAGGSAPAVRAAAAGAARAGRGRRTRSPRTPPFWTEVFHKLARRRGLALEDPVAYHQAFPSLPVPGRAAAVLRGRLPGSASEARLADHSESSPQLTNEMWAAVIVRASESAQPTPPGGVRDPERALVYNVRDGLVSMQRDGRCSRPVSGAVWSCRRGLGLCFRRGPWRSPGRGAWHR